MSDPSIVDPRVFLGRCCMCPNVYRDETSRVCPGSNEILHPKPEPCRFVRAYIDKRGWTYRVCGGIGRDTYKARYWTSDGKRPAGRGVQQLSWRNTFDAAQDDLNKFAQAHGLKVLLPEINNDV